MAYSWHLLWALGQNWEEEGSTTIQQITIFKHILRSHRHVPSSVPRAGGGSCGPHYFPGAPQSSRAPTQ